jgi:sulfite exporter TauE/SafE
MAMFWDLTRGILLGFLPGILPCCFLQSVMKGKNKQKTTTTTTTTHMLGKSPHSLHPKKVSSRVA